MSPDDPRHGTYAGTVAHYLSGIATCPPCREAGAEYRRHRRTRLYLKRSGSMVVPSIGTIRRVQALVALGHSMRDIDNALGRCHGYTSMKLSRYPVTTYPKVAEEYANLYERLCMVRPEGAYANRTRKIAARKGWAPPLAWNDIDDPDERPATPETADRRFTVAALLEDAEWLADADHSLTEVLNRLDVNRNTFRDACRRADRLDLYWRLANREPDADNRRAVRDGIKQARGVA